MRSSLSCDVCRKSKIKCVNSGAAPCQRCQKFEIAGCELSRPVYPSRGSLLQQTGPKRAPRRAPRSRNSTPSSEQGPRQSCRDAAADKHDVDGHLVSSRADVDGHLDSLPADVVIKSLNLFTRKFPELAMIHLPSLLRDLGVNRTRDIKVLVGAVLAVMNQHLRDLNVPWAASLLPKEQYAAYVERILSTAMLQLSCFRIPQALLIMTLYEWGVRDFHKAWIYGGVATRTMQAIYSARISPYGPDAESMSAHGAESLAIETRSFLACFIMDCTIDSGSIHRPMLSLAELRKLKIYRPINRIEYAFGPDHAPQSDEAGQDPACLGPAPISLRGIDDSFDILVDGFDIWREIITFVRNGGRRAPGMCSPENCPWVPQSPWSRAHERLQQWRASQHRSLYYPENPIAVHASLGHGESFAYLNLLYYLSIIMLHREYFPILPASESAPRGPIDQPLLEAEAPVGWWEESANILFTATERIPQILQEASESDAHLITPFAGFSAFISCFMNVYALYFPHMNLGRSVRARQFRNICCQYLQTMRRTWALCEGWFKTIDDISLLYERATLNKERYKGKSKNDFRALYQSIHEYRLPDKSYQHHQEIDVLDRSAGPPVQSLPPHDTDQFSAPASSDSILEQLSLDLYSCINEGGWPSNSLHLAGDLMMPNVFSAE